MADYKDFKNKHRTEWKEFLWNTLAEKIISAKSAKHAKQVFSKLFSDYEKEIIAKRIAALALIQEGKSYKEIGEVLWLSHATISAMKKNFFGGSKIYKSQRSFKSIRQMEPSGVLVRQSWLEDLFGDIDIWELLKNPPRPRGMGLKNSL